jgi:dipeptidyl aminopeptidase/acylaminoacyl peptidase
LHEVRMPGGARRQLTFAAEPVSGGTWQPKHGGYIVYAQDTGGGEFYQYYRLDPESGRITLLTDGKSRNGSGRFTRSGHWFAYTSTRRNGRDGDIYVMDPADPKTDHLLCQVSGGGWSVSDWSEDESKLLLLETLSINQSRLYLLDVGAGTKELLTRDKGEPVSYENARFAHGDGLGIFLTTDKGSEFRRLAKLVFVAPDKGPPLNWSQTRSVAWLTPSLQVLPVKLQWDVEEFDLSPDGKTIAFVSNEDGVGQVRLLDTRSYKEERAPKLPLGIPSRVTWHENGRDLAFNFTSARSPADVYSYDTKNGKVERWTESETGGLNPAQFIEPELVRVKSFDGLQVSGFLYRPDPKKFPGKRPVIVNIHGGPEGQSRPLFQGRNNYYLNELGVAILYPNVRGSSGYGKTFLTVDNGFKREDSVRDIGAFLDWIATDRALDSERVAVMGGSYGGYMTLACLTHYSGRLRCGLDVVGISNFLSFLKNTQDYRRDLRRVEYGDERDPAMAEFLQRISPLTNVEKIGKPLFVVQGQNDPRVPVTEAEQMVKAIRDRGGKVWYLMAKDEGHGFQKKRNADFQFLSGIEFYREYLLR